MAGFGGWAGETGVAGRAGGLAFAFALAGGAGFAFRTGGPRLTGVLAGGAATGPRPRARAAALVGPAAGAVCARLPP
ncbi:MAG: hypothetical protein ACXW08_11335, partial [Solirubrobacteraceae bacterium]